MDSLKLGDGAKMLYKDRRGTANRFCHDWPLSGDDLDNQMMFPSETLFA